MYARLDVLGRLASQDFATPAEYSLAWVLSRPAVAATILGCRNEDQLHSAVRATEITIPSAHHIEIDAHFPHPSLMAEERVLRWRGNAWVLECPEEVR